MRPLNRKADFSLGQNYLLCEFEQVESTKCKKKKKTCKNENKRETPYSTLVGQERFVSLQYICVIGERSWKGTRDRSNQIRAFSTEECRCIDGIL